MESRQLNRNTTVTPFCIRGVKKKSCKCIHRKPGPFLLSQVAVGYICCQRVGKYLITPWTSIFKPIRDERICCDAIDQDAVCGLEPAFDGVIDMW